MKKHNRIIAGIMAVCLAFSVGIIPESIAPVVSMTASAEDYTYENLKYKFLEDGTIEIKRCDKSATDVVIPSEIDGVPVTSIGVYAFGSCENLKSVILPNSIKRIEAHAFDKSSLTEITIPENVVYIGMSAFYCCDLEKMIILNPKIEMSNMLEGNYYSIMIYGYENSTAQEYAEKYNQIFNYNMFPFVSLGKAPTQTVGSGTYGENLTWKLENEVLTISGTGDMENYLLGESPLYKFENVKKVIIEDGITSISDNAFYLYKNLTSVTIPDSVTSIGEGTFYNCTNLISINIPDSVTSIGNSAFSYCRGLTSINIPNNITNIENVTFLCCSSLTEITIPESVNSIDRLSFGYCTALEEITILNPDCEIYDDYDTISDTATIYGYENSTAQEYAEKYGYKFESLGEALISDTADGDINGDGDFNISDVVTFQKYLLGNSDSEISDWKNADLNNDGLLDVFDLVMMKKKLIEK